MQDDEMRKKKERRNLIIYAIMTIIALVAIILIPIIRSAWSSTPTSPDNGLENDETEIVEEDITASYVVFSNAHFIKQTFGTTMASDILDYIQDAVLANYDQPMKLSASVNEKSLVQEIYFPYTTYSMLLDLSDGKTVSVGLATNKNMYVGVLVKSDVASAPVKLSIIFSNNVSESSYDRDAVISGLVKWAKSTTGASEVITTTKN